MPPVYWPWVQHWCILFAQCYQLDVSTLPSPCHKFVQPSPRHHTRFSSLVSEHTFTWNLFINSSSETLWMLQYFLSTTDRGDSNHSPYFGDNPLYILLQSLCMGMISFYTRWGDCNSSDQNAGACQLSWMVNVLWFCLSTSVKRSLLLLPFLSLPSHCYNITRSAARYSSCNELTEFLSI